MNTRPYSDLIAGVAALCGCTLAAAEEERIKRFINRRARKAYAESELWPRFLVVGEERIISEDGLLPYEQSGLDDIGTVLRLHATQPFISEPAIEYGEFYAAASGVQVTGYRAADASSGANMVVTGTLNPDITGTYEPISTAEGRYGTEFATYRSTSNSTHFLYPSIGDTGGVDFAIWNVGDYTGANYWQSGAGSTYITPDIANGDFAAVGSATGDPTITAESVYSIFATYKAALTATYGDGDGETADFPEEWFGYAEWGAYADFLRNDQQQEKARVEDIEAESILQQELDKISRQNGARLITRVMTHANHQSR